MNFQKQKDSRTKSGNSFKIILNDKKNYELNKFFTKQIGKDHFWRDRLVWTDKQWLNILLIHFRDLDPKDNNNELIGYYEIEKHDNKEFELINMGILSEYRSKKVLDLCC